MLKLEIVTPERRVLNEEVDSVTVPTASGEAGILPKHAPLVSAVRPGILAYSLKGTTEKLAVSGGFVEINSDIVSVLVDTAETAAEIDAASAGADLEAAEKALASAGIVEADQAADTRDAVDYASIRLRLASGK